MEKAMASTVDEVKTNIISDRIASSNDLHESIREKVNNSSIQMMTIIRREEVFV